MIWENGIETCIISYKKQIASPGSMREAKVAIRAGATLLVHSIFSEDVDDEFIQLVVDNDVIYTPTIAVIPNWIRAVTSAALGTPNQADDPNGCVDPGTREKIC